MEKSICVCRGVIGVCIPEFGNRMGFHKPRLCPENKRKWYIEKIKCIEALSVGPETEARLVHFSWTVGPQSISAPGALMESLRHLQCIRL